MEKGAVESGVNTMFPCTGSGMSEHPFTKLKVSEKHYNQLYTAIHPISATAFFFLYKTLQENHEILQKIDR